MSSLEERCSLALLVSTDLEMLAPLHIGIRKDEQTHLELSREGAAPEK
jgi:hypothetical protein